jgi:molecular chaperone DnaJ
MAPQREWFEKDYYKVLGVDSSATEKDITRAYRQLAKKYHPDANPGDIAAEERFKEVSAAQEVLSDPEKRKEYDQVREMVAQGVGPGGFGPGDFGGGFGPGGFGAGGQTINFEDLSGLGDLFGNIFGGAGGAPAGGRRRGRRGPVGPTPGADIEAELHLAFLDAVNGITTSVHFTSEAVCSVCHGSGAKPGTAPETCPTCGGAGDVLVDQGPFSFSQVCPQCGGRGAIVKDKCKNCKGRGVEVRPREVKVKIPAGVQGGQRIRVAGRGAPGLNGGPPGDLYVVVHVAHHPVFGRSGKTNLTVRVPLTFPEAALGTQVKVPTLESPVTLKVPPGTQSGTTQKVKGRGIVPAKGPAGDLLVTFLIDVPTQLTDEQRSAIEALAQVMPDTKRADLEV